MWLIEVLVKTLLMSHTALSKDGFRSLSQSTSLPPPSRLLVPAGNHTKDHRGPGFQRLSCCSPTQTTELEWYQERPQWYWEGPRLSNTPYSPLTEEVDTTAFPLLGIILCQVRVIEWRERPLVDTEWLFGSLAVHFVRKQSELLIQTRLPPTNEPKSE